MVKYLTAVLLLMCTGAESQDQQGPCSWPEKTVGEIWAEHFLSEYEQHCGAETLIELAIEFGLEKQIPDGDKLLSKLQENNPELQEGFQKRGVLGKRKRNPTQELKKFCRAVWRDYPCLETPPYNACPKAAFVLWAKRNRVDISRLETRPYKRRHRPLTGE